MLRESESEYLFDPLQWLLSPRVVNRRAWSHRRLLKSMQRGTRIKSCTNKYDNHYCFSMAVLFGRVMLKVSLSAIFMLTVLNCNITKLCPILTCFNDMVY